MQQAKRRQACLALAAFTSIFIAGCQGLAPAKATFGQKTENWSGRLALQVDGSETQSFSASFELRGRAEAGELSLFSPLGSTLAVLQWSPGSATLRSGNDSRDFGSLDTLAAQVTGTAIPVAALFDWLAGTPTPVPGWQPDLRQQAEGRISARRTDPQPAATLRVVFER
ncbi:outer membrane lipoprotein LolB [Xylophilus sp. GW821-FHT01B05]